MKTIVQIGVADGDDHVFRMISENNFKDIFAIFIEPNPYSIPLIQKRYENLTTKIISNFAISDANGIIKLYFPFDYKNGNSQVASIDKNHLIQHGNPEYTLTQMNVQCFTLNTYLNYVLGLDLSTNIDTLYIDTEGHDCDIIMNIDFHKLNINNICFEFWHTDGPHSGATNMYTEKFIKTDEYLKQNKYSISKIDKESGSVYYSKS